MAFVLSMIAISRDGYGNPARSRRPIKLVFVAWRARSAGRRAANISGCAARALRSRKSSRI